MRLAVMRPRDKLEGSVRLAESLGFQTIAASPLRIEVRDSPGIDDLLSAVAAGRVGAIVLTSTTGVDALVELMALRGAEGPGALLSSCLGIAIGPLTAQAMRDADIRVDHVPEEFTSEGLVRSLASSLRGKTVYVLRSSHGERILVEGLRETGSDVREVVLYDLVPQPDADDMRSLAIQSMEGGVDAFAFSSALSAATFIEAVERVASREEVLTLLNSRTVGAMGGPTRRKLEKMGIIVRAVPAEATFEALLKAIRDVGSPRPNGQE